MLARRKKDINQNHNEFSNYVRASFHIAEQVTKTYSTSFYSAARLLDRDIRNAIFSIYGFVRFADEIVDTFHKFDKESLLQKFEHDCFEACKTGISMNPILFAFKETVKKYNIPDEYIRAFLRSMKADLTKKNYENAEEMNGYIYGSADVVGLMCLKVFCDGNEQTFKQLEKAAMKLGSAFQKVNFLRDLKSDVELLNRHYFPDTDITHFNESAKNKIISDIENDFKEAFSGLKMLPQRAKLAVSVAYYYYSALLKKIKHTSAEQIKSKRIRIPNAQKFLLFVKAYIMNKLRII